MNENVVGLDGHGKALTVLFSDKLIEDEEDDE
jgi:hypothetical protein